MTLGKFLGGGLSIGAFGGKTDIMDMFDPRKENFLRHSGTFNNNTLAMAVGCAAIRDIYTPERANELNALGEEVRGELNNVVRKSQLPMQFTGVGSIMNVHMMKNVISRPEDLIGASGALKELYYFYLLSKGIYTAYRGMVNLSLETKEKECAQLVAETRNFVREFDGILI